MDGKTWALSPDVRVSTYDCHICHIRALLFAMEVATYFYDAVLKDVGTCLKGRNIIASHQVLVAQLDSTRKELEDNMKKLRKADAEVGVWDAFLQSLPKDE
eukprot:CAMPEP_0184655246 /NCGR_PEP_ID=MMETSP0308-20130426/12871_1 /TAXON_ID=38269 /ORGANISM="Gloeochaete witrockiana, Strain SAG 46.84" /LENGTH=100 /DNA_ID=CAMNT_0027091615 /DNA_START=465 /DNA_END=764 /DNA_ORIENTATION=+